MDDGKEKVEDNNNTKDSNYTKVGKVDKCINSNCKSYQNLDAEDKVILSDFKTTIQQSFEIKCKSDYVRFHESIKSDLRFNNVGGLEGTYNHEYNKLNCSNNVNSLQYILASQDDITNKSKAVLNRSVLSREDYIKLHEEYSLKLSDSKCSLKNKNSYIFDKTNSLSIMTREEHIKLHEEYNLRLQNTSCKSHTNEKSNSINSIGSRKSTSFVLGELPKMIKQEPVEPELHLEPPSTTENLQIIIKPVKGSSVQSIIEGVVQNMCKTNDFNITIKEGSVDINVSVADGVS